MRTGIAPRPDAVPRPTVGRRLRVGTAIASALVLVLTGGAWGLYRNVTAGITTTDVIRGGSSDGAQNILLVGVDSREDAQGNPLPQSVLDQLHGGPDTGVLNSDTIIVLHVPAGGGAAVAFSIPRDAYVDIPGYRRDKINAAYPAMKALVEQQLMADGARDRREIAAEASARGRTALIGAVEDLTGLTIDHYAEINLVGFATLTEAIGGVPVCLAAPTRDGLSGAQLPRGRPDDLRRLGARVRPPAPRPAAGRPVAHPPPAGVPRRDGREAALGGHVDQPLGAGCAARRRPAVRRDRLGLGPARASPRRRPTSRRATSRSSPSRPAGAENNSRGDVVLVDSGVGAGRSSTRRSRPRTPRPRRRRAGPRARSPGRTR